MLFRTNGQARALEEAFRRHGIQFKVLGAAASRRPSLPIREILTYIRAIINPADGSGLLRAISLPLAVPQKGVPSIGARTRARIEEWASSSNVSIDAALSLIAAECTYNSDKSIHSPTDKKNASNCFCREGGPEPIVQLPRNSSADMVVCGPTSPAELCESAVVIKKIGLTARQASAVSTSTLLLMGFRSDVENGIAVSDLVSSVLDRAGFRSRCEPEYWNRKLSLTHLLCL